MSETATTTRPKQKRNIAHLVEVNTASGSARLQIRAANKEALYEVVSEIARRMDALKAVHA